jgi:hypothetical protein
MSALRPLMLQERRQSGHGNTSRSCQEATYASQQIAPLSITSSARGSPVACLLCSTPHGGPCLMQTTARENFQLEAKTSSGSPPYFAVSIGLTCELHRPSACWCATLSDQLFRCKSRQVRSHQQAGKRPADKWHPPNLRARTYRSDASNVYSILLCPLQWKAVLHCSQPVRTSSVDILGRPGLLENA